MKELPILDPNNYEKEVCTRDMRAYYVKSETEYSELAYKKYTQDLETRNSQNGS
jgi:hypothetical protein